MKNRLCVIAMLALGGAVGCDGGAGPAMPPFNPFGNDPSNVSSEPAGGSNETPPSSGGGQTIAQLCATDCARIAAACPSAASPNCLSSCDAEPQTYPACISQVQAFLECYTTAAISCTTTYGTSTSTSVSGCTAAEQALVSCINPGTTVSTSGAS
jgi:hypothetical protein